MVARFRPQNKIEFASGGEPIVDFENEETCKINVSRAWRVESYLAKPSFDEYNDRMSG